ncbi:DUF4097 family beta strand repeat-containing protein [Paenibacillus pini]|uniref:DUF4097 domain-containing protein n=1 Tax=Paenibacillus pini JCM 16418 TaxID=1236976 RepID=W7YMI4_9BACL|nr:DUF4097 family beta strand repeat-containing protein [Paenibacillus pini]GAF09657.1 hypothetical protein JCM16418_3810 [Paenibacillus pini JCM 16418]
MNTIYKKTSGILIALGLALVTSACTTDSSSQDTSSSYEEKNYTVESEKVSQISLTTQDRAIELIASNDKQIHIDYFESEKESYDLKVSDNKELTMNAVNHKNWKDYIGLDTEKTHRNIKIAVPTDIASGIHIKTTNGDIKVSKLNIAGAVDLANSGGKIELKNVAVDKSLVLKTKNDDMLLSDVNIKGSVDASNSDGNIKVTSVGVDDTLKLNSKNGDITGTIKGSYDVFNISSKASKGKNNLPENKSGGNKTLEVNTNNGDINLEFVK